MSAKNANWKNMNGGTAGGGAVYGLGLIGALVYFIQNANSLVDGIVGIFLAIIWPAVFVYRIFEFLQL